MYKEPELDSLDKFELIRMITERDDRIKQLSKGRIESTEVVLKPIIKNIVLLAKDREVTNAQVLEALTVALIPTKKGKRKPSSKHTHRHPNDTTLTCIKGSSRKPDWVKKWLSEGHAEDELLEI